MRQIVVRKDSGITGIDDLINKTVSVGASESGSEKNAEQILKMSGITDELINKVNMDYTEAAENLKLEKLMHFSVQQEQEQKLLDSYLRNVTYIL